VCSGGAGDFAEAAQKLGCDLYLTGEASWGDVVGAKNVGIKMLCAGHYETEVFGVRALAKMMSAEIKIKTIDIT
jgi:putative NIF3 family GTP cyclohydrolase 1 type 2